MRLSETQMSGFDISAILTHMSPPRPYNTSTLTPPNHSNWCPDNDELLTILEKISLTGHQLQVELENAKMREIELVDKIKCMQSNSNGFHKISTAKKHANISPSKFVMGESLKQENGSDRKMDDINSRCEKLQDAMLSLQDENIKLNRILRDQSLSLNTNEATNLLTDATSENCIVELQDRLLDREREIAQLQQKVEQMKESVMVSEKDLREERDKAAKLKQEVAEANTAGGDCVPGMQSRSQYNEQQLLKLCAELQTKLDKVQLENKNYMTKIDSLEEENLKALEILKNNEETFNFRIEELHTMLVTKDKEIEHLQDKLNGVTEQLAEKDKATNKIKNSDITKRKEVLLLCEKYEQLKKNKKRLESDLYESQQKVQEATTRSWALETSIMKASEENQILKHQLKIHESLVSASSEAKSNDQQYVAKILKDYEKLTEKYEALLDLRINEYGRIKRSGRDGKSAKEMEGGKLTSRYEQVEKKEDGDILYESMRKRQRDFNRYYALDSIERIPSKPVDSIANTHWDHSRGERQTHTHGVQEKIESPSMPLNGERYEKVTGQNFNYSLKSKDNIKNVAALCSSAVPVAGYKSTSDIKKMDTKAETSDRYVTDSNIKTSTPVKPYNSQELLMSRNKLDQKYWTNSKIDDSVLAQKLSTKADLSRSRSIEFSQPRSKSLSPIRPSMLRGSEECNYESLPSSSRESQKSVSFLLSPLHRRSKSTSAVVDKRYFSKTPTSIEKTSVGKRTSLSPVEVLERVKSAYQEEYLQNMVGVDFILSPGNSPPNKKGSVGKKAMYGIRKLNDGAKLSSERYKKKSESIRGLVDKNYGYGNSFTIADTSSSTNSSSPKGILKKPCNGFQSKERSVESDDTFMNSPSSKHKSALLFVRETENDSCDVNSISGIAPPEMFQDTGKEMNSKRRLTFVENDIIEVKARTAQKGESFISSSSSENAKANSTNPSTHQSDTLDKFRIHTNAREVSSDHTKKALHGMIKDLTVPIQLAGAMKDDDMDSIGQSSVSSTQDHIGRFEFLQEMQTALKSPTFSYLKNAESGDSMVSSPKIENDAKGKANPELGLSARQQEYADKLIKKYMKKSTGNKFS